jgi:glycosyltransferase involved in cell wall biosynthesis
MRILVVTRHNFVVGGVETYLRALLPLLRARGHEVGLAYEHRGADEAALDPREDAPSWAIDAPESMRAIKTWKPDVVYVHGLDRKEVEDALLDGFPALSHVHNYVATCISGAKTRRLPLLRGCERRLGPACLALYLPCRCGGLNPITMLRSYRAARQSLEALKRYGLVLVASPHMREECLKNGVPATNLRIVPPFHQNVAGRPTPPVSRGVPGANVLLTGRLAPPKGGVELVDAMALASRSLGRKLHLDVTGDGPERAAIESRAKKRGLSVAFHGWIEVAQLTGLMERVDVLAVPSLWPEPFGAVGLEAGSYGLPSVAFATGGIPSWLRAGVSGELAPIPPTVGGLADALARALRDPGHLDALRLGAWRVAREFSRDGHVDGIEAALVDVTRSYGMAKSRAGPALADPESNC